MTTVVDPVGTPAIIFNREGTTIISIEAAEPGTVVSDATEIPRYSEVTVVLVSAPTSTSRWVRLPDDAEIGDIVEVHYVRDNVDVGSLHVFAPEGETIATSNAHDAVDAIFRKTSATGWWYLLGQ
jgi:uncharacterized Zn finger protein